MAKRKKKTFPKDKILGLFANQNYQKVVSKIKQFNIEGMDDLEVDKLHVDSLKMLSNERFEAGDIQRAIRDIELAISIKPDNSLEFLRLKYLCYLDSFSDAKIYSNELLQKYKSDKNIIFYSLLIELYLSNNIDDKQLKKVTKAKQEYLLAISALFSDNRELALKHLNNSKPRAKAEKENIEALKAILLQKTDFQSENIKPLYKFLLFGDDANLQNSKNSRKFRDEIIKNLKQDSNTNSLNKLISLDGYIDNAIVKKENNPKLALNNIIMMLEKQQEPDYWQIYKIFISYEKEFIQIPESIYVFINILNNVSTEPLINKTVSFVDKFLNTHIKKFTSFAIKYVLYKLLYFNLTEEKSVAIIEPLFDKYGDKDIFYTTLTLALNYDSQKMYNSYKEHVDSIFKKYNHINSNIVGDMVEVTNSLEYVLMFADDEDTKDISKKIENSLYVIKNLDDVDERYKTLFLKILNNYAKAISIFDEDELDSGYDDMKEVLKKYIDMFNYEESQFCEDAEEFLDSTANIQDEYDLDIAQQKYIKFKMALQTGYDPFVELNDYPDLFIYFYIQNNKTAVLDLIALYARFEELDDKVIIKIFRLTHFSYKSEPLRTTIQTLITQYAKENLEVSQKIFQYIIKSTNAENVWYLHWLYSYMDMVDVYSLAKDDFFISCLNTFLDTQKRKKFKSIQKRYALVVDRFCDECENSTILINQQQTFEF
ncbi:MAG: hypothetical protein U9N42_03145 [Campylobacterota bacterium]|nr:hypothetical protein [Campylobacterota bacterium]